MVGQLRPTLPQLRTCHCTAPTDAMCQRETSSRGLQSLGSRYWKRPFVRKLRDQRKILVPPSVGRITCRIEGCKEGWNSKIVEMFQDGLAAQRRSAANLRYNGSRQM